MYSLCGSNPRTMFLLEKIVLKWFVIGALLLNASVCWGSSKVTQAKKAGDIIGSSHVAGRYNFTEKDFLNEGADALLEMGSRVIKLWFVNNPAGAYPFNSTWEKKYDLVSLAKTKYYRDVFAKPFTTIILGVNNYTVPVNKIHSSAELEKEKKALYELTKYLLVQYKRSGKTFILQNWEGDWLLTNPDFSREVTDTAVNGMIALVNARQDGVNRARKEVGMDGVKVAHAAEVNLVVRAMEGKRTATNDVIPYTYCDLYSYSAYDSCLKGAKEFREAMDYLASKAPDSEMYGSKNVFVGEFGAPENQYDQKKIVQWTTEAALEWGAPYIVYWQVYCNEPMGGQKNTPKGERFTNEEMRGFWLIRPDGTKSPAYEYFLDKLK